MLADRWVPDWVDVDTFAEDVLTHLQAAGIVPNHDGDDLRRGVPDGYSGVGQKPLHVGDVVPQLSAQLGLVPRQFQRLQDACHHDGRKST